MIGIRTLTFFCFAAVTLAAADPDPQVQTTQPGVRLSLVAEHSQLATPTGVDVDDQGRIWVVATHTHFRPDDYDGPTHDEILVFSKTGDGPADRRVFYNATSATMDLELGNNGWVYLAERDRILRIRDSDGDGRADVEEDIVVLNSEADYPHNGLSGLAWHPNGDLMFGLGENFARPWTLTGSDGVVAAGAGEGGIFRCTADGKKLRWISRGLWNPFGVCVRADGEIFAAENDPGERPPCRLLHIVDGGEYGYRRKYGPEAHHPFVCWNGELRGTLPMIHPTGEAPCGILPLGRGLLVTSWGDHRIDFMPLRRAGASFESERVTIAKGGRYFRPTCIARDPSATDGHRVWYLTDWVDGRYDAHGFGRLWKLEIKLNEAPWVGSLLLEPPTEQAQLAAELRNDEITRDRSELMQLAADADPFLARAALTALSRKAPAWSPDEVRRWPDGERVQAAMALNLANAAPNKWIQFLLADIHPDVQFEALRWIANSELDQFLPDVEAVLNQSDIDFRLFEAAMATWNTLSGKPEAGVRDPEILLARVRDTASAPRLRAYALRLLPTQARAAGKDGSTPVTNFPKGLSLDLLRTLLSVNDSTLSLEVVRTLAGNAPVSQELLASIAGDANRHESLRAEAIAGLAAIAEQHTDLLFELVDDEQRAVREEALRCLRSTRHTADQMARLQAVAQKYPDSADLVQAVLDPKSLKSGRPAVTDTNAWLRILESIETPADPDSGRRIFHHAKVASCSNCHRHNGRGNVVGPDLTGQGKQNSRERLLKSILNPSSDIAPEYQARTIVLNDGRSFTGIRLRSYTKEQIRDANGQTRTFDRGDVESMVDSNTSFMPSGLVDLLTLRELRDLMAFLQSDAGNEGGVERQHAATLKPLVRVIDLNAGETAHVKLCNGAQVEVKLVKLVETRDRIRQAVRSAKVTVQVDGEEITLESGMYNLPRRVAGVQIDCSITSGYNSNGTPGFWGLDRDARLRLWPADSPLLRPGSLIYPVDQRWFATRTWFDNEPVDGGTRVLPKIYYHSGLDIGGSERQVTVLAATDAVVVSSGNGVLPEYLLEGGTAATYGDGRSPVAPRADVVYLRDKRGWFYRYSHLDRINDAIRPGRVIEQGTEIGRLGKKGASGGWSHLHFEIKSRQPSGKWGTQAGYAFLWEAYRNQYQPQLIANARRKSFLLAGDEATLDGSKSWSAANSIKSYEWTFSDGNTHSGPRVTRVYEQPGVFSEILKVTDSAGNTDYDFAEVHVLDPQQPDQYVPRIHAAYWPTFANRVNKPITFKVRSFGNQYGNEVWDFGDGSPLVTVRSDGNADPQAKDGYATTHHSYERPGDYIVTVQRCRADGVTATARLHVHVDSDSP